MRKNINLRSGLTLIEVIWVSALFTMIVSISAYIFSNVVNTWTRLGKSTSVDIIAVRAIDRMTYDLRVAKNILAVNNDEIRFTADGTNFYIYYLFNAADAYPSSFSGSSYSLMKAGLAAGLSGTFTYGDGTIIATNILPPPVSDLSINAALAIIDLSVSKDNKTRRLKTKVLARNQL